MVKKALNEDAGLSWRDPGTADAMSDLLPTSRIPIYDLLQQARVSVDGWHRKASGQPVKRYKSNPHYCYNWSFGSLDEGIVLCLWDRQLKDDDGVVFVAENYRASAEQRQAVADDVQIPATRRQRAGEQAERGRAVDKAVRDAYRAGQPVHVVINVGKQSDQDKPGQDSSSVKARRLDNERWYVHEYDNQTGKWRLVRGVPGPAAADVGERQPERVLGDPSEPEDETQQRAIKTRRGQPRFRALLRAAYGDRCAVTGSRVVDLLEAAHVIPHSEQTDYSVRNGLLLRSDIHTLFDLGLLSIDGRFKVHLAHDLMTSEYARYDGMSLMVLPESFSDQPNPDSLERRNAVFLHTEAQRLKERT